MLLISICILRKNNQKRKKSDRGYNLTTPVSFINGETARFGIIGFPLKHTKSPAMHNGFFSRHQLNSVYFPFEVGSEDFSRTVPFLKSLYKGFNVTVPFKEEIIPFLDDVTDAAKLIGAVNTVYFEGDRWLGDNTDWSGFLENIEIDYKVFFKDKKILFLGAGGSARACVYAAIQGGVKEITVANRTVEKAKKLIQSIRSDKTQLEYIGIGNDELTEVSVSADIIVNTTSIGLKENDIRYFSFEKVKKDAFAYDLVYGVETDFIKKAKINGNQTGVGQGMLVRQGAKSLKIWTEIEPDITMFYKDAGFMYNV